MNCKKCSHAQETGDVYYYKWKGALIEMKGCITHVMEIFAALGESKKGDKKDGTKL